MTLLLIGVLLFCGVHLSPALVTGRREALRATLGENPYRAVFSLIIVAALVLIVVGWRSAVPSPVYEPPLGPNALSSLLILVGLVLFFASQASGNIKRVIRHPQMTGTVLWGIAHLLNNGDSRSVVLFGGLTLWAILEIILTSRRDGDWRKPGRAPIVQDVIPVVVGTGAFAAIAYFHGTLFGVPAWGIPVQ